MKRHGSSAKLVEPRDSTPNSEKVDTQHDCEKNQAPLPVIDDVGESKPNTTSCSMLGFHHQLVAPGPPPDGGMTAWLQVLAAHCGCIVTWGLVSSFGVFQSYYDSTLGYTPSETSWVGTIQIFFLLGLGGVSGRATDAGFAHETVLVGTILIVLGLSLTSLATQYYQTFLSQGVCVGIGMGLVLIPVMAVSSAWFKAKKNLAVAIIASGAGTGGLIYPAVFRELLPRIGHAWTLRVMALVTLVLSGIISLSLRVRIPPRKAGPLVDLAAWKEPSYALYTIGYFLVYWATYFAFYYVDSYGQAYASFSATDSINLLLIINAIGVPGRILPGYISSRFLGPLNTAVPTAFLVALMLFLWIAVGDSRPGLYAFACIYGLFASAIQSLFAVSLTAITDDLDKLGTRMGMVFSIIAFAGLTGGPISGAFVGPKNDGYLGAQIWAGTAMACGGLALGAARVKRTGWVLRVKT